MPSTNTLQRAINLAQQAIRNAPLTGVGGVANEPALSMGDWVRDFMLGPPFAWRWNRASVSFSTVVGQQDYVQSGLTSFGWLEKATLSNSTNPAFEMVPVLMLGESGMTLQPTHVSAYLDNDSGQITFRFMPLPDQIYTATVWYQKSAPNFAALTDTWTPIPDYFSNLYNTGILAKAFEYWGDPRQVSTMQMFVRQVIAANGGLDESQVNIFLGEYINSAAEKQSKLTNIGVAKQSRALF